MNISPNNPSSLLAPVGIVACDAGAANLIAAWWPLLPKPLRVCAEGPAVQIIQKVWPQCEFESLEKVVSSSSVVLTGTGWSSDLEHNARRYAKRTGLFTMAVIDHWVNYRDRFIRDEEEILPDVIIVRDDYAKLEAKRCFEHTLIVQWHNLYLDAEVKKIKILRVQNTLSAPKKILMVMEPIRKAWPGDDEQGEFIAVNYFISNLHLMDYFADQVEIKVRPHPSDWVGKYTEMINRHSLMQICISEGLTLAEDIAWADLVVGCESFALVVALGAGVSTMSILPPHAPSCRLPHSDLKHLNQLVFTNQSELT